MLEEIISYDLLLQQSLNVTNRAELFGYRNLCNSNQLPYTKDIWVVVLSSQEKQKNKGGVLK